MNSRKYPRTLQDAFHNTVEYGCAIEKPSSGDLAVKWAVITAAVFVVCLLVVEKFA